MALIDLIILVILAELTLVALTLSRPEPRRILCFLSRHRVDNLTYRESKTEKIQEAQK